MPVAHTYFHRKLEILQQHAHPYYHQKRHPMPPGGNGGFPPPPDGAWTVRTLWARYGLPMNLAGDGVIGIYEAGGGWTSEDVAANFKMLGQPVPEITDVSVDSTANNRDPRDPASVEVMLDIVAAGGAFYEATGKPAKMRIYWSQGFAAAIDEASKDKCRVLSFSWGASQAVWGQPGLPETTEEFDAAAEPAVAGGMAITAAAGDNDADDGGGVAAVDFPAGSKWVIASGGTSLTATTEMVWNNNPGNPSGEGTGGGYTDNSSGNFPMPAWQVGLVPPPPQATMGRMVPDVAAVADPSTGVYIIVDNQPGVIGGTSFVAPFYAGIIAAASSGPLPLLTPLFYAEPLAFNDITEGDNGVYRASVGPDPCTGMGSPKAALMAVIAAAKA